MSSVDNAAIIGEYWAFKKPIPYTLAYFEFIPARGGFASSGASLQFEFTSPDAAILLDSVFELKKSYPFSSVSITHGESEAVKISIFSYCLYDFDFNFALEIENSIFKFTQAGKLRRLVTSTNWGEHKVYRALFTPERIVLNEESISLVGSDPDVHTGLEKLRIRVDFYHKREPDDQAFFSELYNLLDASNLEFLEYRGFDKHYMMFVGNGRLGVSGSPVTCSNIGSFEKGLVELMGKYNYLPGHDPAWSGLGVGSSNYNALVATDVIVVKDARKR